MILKFQGGIKADLQDQTASHPGVNRFKPSKPMRLLKSGSLRLAIRSLTLMHRNRPGFVWEIIKILNENSLNLSNTYLNRHGSAFGTIQKVLYQ